MEFVNAESRELFLRKGMEHGTNAPHTSQSNGLVERDVRILQDTAKALLIQSGLGN